ncbi:MAG: hypothetical protein GY756_24960 [bacterium]|nr:hypothetical protein [bacterium]
MIYSKKEKIVIVILSIICIIGFFLFTVMNVLDNLGLIEDYLNYYTHSLKNPIYDICWVITISLTILFILTLKGFIKEYKFRKANKNLFYGFSLFVLLVFITLYYPNYIPFDNINTWIVVDFFGGIYNLFYLMHIFHTNEH